MLTKKDYIKILNYYKIEIPESNKLIKEKASDILAIKLCRCLRKTNVSVGICSKSVFNKKGLHRNKFTCKKKPKVSFTKLRNKSKLTRKNKK
jgi:hypothetical protein